MSVSVFIDTNILVYSIDHRYVEKNQSARKFLLEIQADDNINPVISTQVLQEFYMVATKKLKLDKIVVKNIVQEFAKMQIVNNDIKLVMSAIDISINHHLTLWDALMIAAAKRVQCSVLYSEDLHHGHIIDDVQIINPFIEK